MVLLLATVAASAASVAATESHSLNASRITKIMHRLRDVHRFEAVAISPNGQTVAWVITKLKRKEVSAAPQSKANPKTTHKQTSNRTKRPGQLLQIARFDGRHVRTVIIPNAVRSCHFSDLTWSPDGKWLAFLSNCNHGKNASGQLDPYVVKRTSDRAHRIAKLDGFVHELAWMPNGTKLSFLYVEGDRHPISAVSATKPRVGVIGKTGIEHQQVAVIRRTGGKVVLVTPASLFVYEYDWSPKGHRLAFIGAPPPGRDNWWVANLYTQTLGKAPRIAVNPSSVKGSLRGLQIALPRWSPNGRQIAFIGGLMSDQGATGGDIYVISARRGGSPTNITPGIPITPSWLTWTGRDSLLVSSFAGGSTQIAAFRLHGRAPATRHPLFTVAAGTGDGTFASAISLSANHKALAFIRSTFDHPPEIDTAELKTKKTAQPIAVTIPPHPITHANSRVKTMWGKAISIHWHNQGFPVQGWLLFPPNYNPHKHYPMIVYVHGGPSWATRPRWPGDGYGPVPLAAMGYFVFMPNPRGSFGEGEKFTKAVRKNMGYGDLRDILAGIDKIEARYPIDNNRLGITGWSYGGFMSMFAPTQTHRFKAAVIGAGLSDWKSYYGENSIDKWMIPFFGASVYQDPKAYAKSSAINFIQNDKTPSLLVVGQYDGECPAPQSFEFWHGLRAMGVPTKLVVYPGEGHGFHKPKDRRNVLKRALRWFGKYIGQGPG